MKVLIICIATVSGWCYLSNVMLREAEKPVIAPPVVTQIKQDTILDKLSHAVAKIESNGNYKARRFEPAVFKRLTGRVASNLAEAKAINWRAAMMSTSIGRYQILGTNYRKAGFAKVEQMFRADSVEQDSAFRRFLRSQGLVRLVHERKWKAFARCYNGRGYKKNKYDQKLLAEMR